MRLWRVCVSIMAHEHISTPELITRLLSSQREEDLDPFVVLTFMPLDSYAQVADIGCGPGYFSIPLDRFFKKKSIPFGKDRTKIFGNINNKRDGFVFAFHLNRCPVHLHKAAFLSGPQD